MSRSRKKTPGYCDSNKFAKSYANGVVRRKNKISIQDIDIEDDEFLDKVPSGKKYRLLYDPWNICDWKWLYFSEIELKDYFVEYDYREIDDILAIQKYIKGRHRMISK